MRFQIDDRNVLFGMPIVLDTKKNGQQKINSAAPGITDTHV